MLKLFNYEFSFRRDTTQWAAENEIHVWEYIFRIEKVTEYEKKHREDLKVDNSKHEV